MIKDVTFAFISFGIVGLLAASYLVRVLLRGRARHVRTDADGGSVFLNKASMEMGYWLTGPVVDWFESLRMTPNQVTALSLIPATLAGVAGAFGWFGLAAFLATIAAYGDIIDGLLARKLGTSSDAGEMLDAVVDRFGEFMFLAGLAIYYRTHWMVEGLVLVAIFGSFMFSYVTAKSEAAGVKPPRGSMRRAERAVYLLVGSAATAVWKLFFGDSASHLLHEFPIILAVTVVGVVANVSVVQRCASIIQTLRERAAAAGKPLVTVASPSAPSAELIAAQKDQAGSV